MLFKMKLRSSSGVIKPSPAVTAAAAKTVGKTASTTSASARSDEGGHAGAAEGMRRASSLSSRRSSGALSLSSRRSSGELESTMSFAGAARVQPTAPVKQTLVKRASKERYNSRVQRARAENINNRRSAA